jgi:rubrerythrin
MNLSGFGPDTLLAIAIRSEVESRKVYEHLEERSRSFMVRDRFIFLAQEESKDERFLREVFHRTFPHGRLEVPEDTPVPVPEVRYSDDMPVSGIIEQVMDAERVAQEYCLSMADFLGPDGDDDLIRALKYLANMERAHYHILESELESSRIFENHDAYWEMMHAGP